MPEGEKNPAIAIDGNAESKRHARKKKKGPQITGQLLLSPFAC